MARKIEFLAPVGAMRGNLSGKQALKYPTKDNSAWEAPRDKRSYATNYNARYIGAKRSADGKKYFAVKQRAAVTNTPAQREAQALLGASKIIADSMLKDITIITPLMQMYDGYVKRGLNYHPAWIPSDIAPGHPSNSIRRYLMRNIRELTLIPKNKQFVVQPQSGNDIVYNNPWRFNNNTGTKVDGITDLFVKFWQQLSPSRTNGAPCYFYVAGLTGIAFTNSSFDEISGDNGDTQNYGTNVLGLTPSAQIGTKTYLMLGQQYLLYNNDYVLFDDDIVVDGKYHLTDIAPTA